VRTLHRKLLRELRENAVTLLVIVVIIAIGTGSLIGLAATQRILIASQSAYYRRYRLADFWVHVKKAPMSVLRRIARLPGIDSVDARVVFDVIIDIPDVPRPLTGRLISTPLSGFDRTLNGICLTRGSGFSHERDAEVILSESFAKANGLDLGDRIHVILNRRRQAFTIVGLAISPEYVYMVRGPGDLVPDPKHFGVLYVKDRYAREILGFKDAFNELVGQLVPRRVDQIDAVLDSIDRILGPYGVLDKMPRSRQASHRFLSDEIQGLGVTAAMMPAIFLGVAALVLNIVMIRLAQRQRTVIGTLKALGYSDRRVMIHYLLFGVIVGLVGGAAGCALGLSTTAGMIQVYRSFFQFPEFLVQVYPDLLIIGVCVSVVFSVLGTARGVWTVLKLQPAEAMRPRPPERGGAVFLECFPRLWGLLGFQTQWAVRNLLRNRIRTITSIVAFALSISIIFIAMVMYDSFVYLLDYQFERVAHADMDIGLRDESAIAALWEARDLPGVDYAEPIFAIVCDLRHGRYARRISVTGLAPQHRLTTPQEDGGQPVRIPETGLVMARKLAELLHVAPGDVLELTPVRGQRRRVKARVAQVVDTYLGLTCYADQRYLWSLVGEESAVNALQVLVNPGEIDEFYRKLKRLPNARTLSVRAEARQNIEKTLVEATIFSIGLMVIFAGIIAFGSTLNNALIEIGDRMREISTLRILGYHPREIAGMLFRQTAITFVIGTVLSFPLGLALIHWIASAYDSELYRTPIVVRPPLVLLTVVLAFLFVLVAQALVYRQIRALDWLEGVKVKE